MDDDGDGNDERSEMFAYLMGVRDKADPGREATAGEMEAVAIALYSYFVKKYLEGVGTGIWERWHEENDFPRHKYEDHSSRDNGSVFDGFDFNEWADQEHVNGVEGTKAVEVCPGLVKKKKMWNVSLCGIGLENSTKNPIKDHLDAEGAMTATVHRNKEANIWNDITFFYRTKKCAGAMVEATGSIFSGPVRSNRR